jgi:hypothetical protein
MGELNDLRIIGCSIGVVLLFVVGVIQGLFRSIGGWLGLLAALLTAGFIYLLWLEATKHDPGPAAGNADPGPAPCPGTETDTETEAREDRDA